MVDPVLLICEENYDRLFKAVSNMFNFLPRTVLYSYPTFFRKLISSVVGFEFMYIARPSHRRVTPHLHPKPPPLLMNPWKESDFKEFYQRYGLFPQQKWGKTSSTVCAQKLECYPADLKHCCRSFEFPIPICWPILGHKQPFVASFCHPHVTFRLASRSRPSSFVYYAWKIESI